MTEDSFDDEELLDLESFFSGPIASLEKQRSESCDGAFLALSASLAMYERFLIKLAQSKGLSTEDGRMAIGGEDLGGIGEEKFRIFWGCFRDGLQHQFQPTRKRGGKTYDWRISHTHDEIPEVTIIDNRRFVVKISPWGFAKFVRRRFDENPTFFQKAKSHKPGTVRPIGSTSSVPVQSSSNIPYQMRPLDTGHFQFDPRSKPPGND